MRAAAGALVVHQATRALVPTASGERKEYVPSAQLAKRLPSAWPRPAWHAPWKMYRVVSGHLGCARLFLLTVVSRISHARQAQHCTCPVPLHNLAPVSWKQVLYNCPCSAFAALHPSDSHG